MMFGMTWLGLGLLVFNATFNNISVITWWSVLLVEKTTDLPQVTDKLYHNVRMICSSCYPMVHNNIKLLYMYIQYIHFYEKGLKISEKQLC